MGVLTASLALALLLTSATSDRQVSANHSEPPLDFEVVEGDEKLIVSWRPIPDHSYTIAYRQFDADNPNEWIFQDINYFGEYRYEISGLENGIDYEVKICSESGLRSVNGRECSWSDFESPIDPHPANENSPPRWRSTLSTLLLEENTVFEDDVIDARATDRDRGDVINYEIETDPKGGPFAINARDGKVYVWDKLDFEDQERWELIITATDLLGEPIEHRVRVNVEDTEGPPEPTITQICASNRSVNVSWAGNKDYTYHLRWRDIARDYGGVRSGEESGLTGASYMATGLNNGTPYVFQLRAINPEGEQSKWSSEEVAAPATSSANNPPEFRREEYQLEVPEEQDPGAEVGDVSATDQDVYSIVRYEIYETQPAGGPFEIDSSTGVITTTDILDFETVDFYRMTLVARDSCGLTDVSYANISISNIVEIDVTPPALLAPSIALGHRQAVVFWDSFGDLTYDLDWRASDGSYLPRPRDSGAVSPRVVDLTDGYQEYAFRVRAVNRKGEIGEWSPESTVSINGEPPTIDPVEDPRPGAALGGAVPYLSSISLKKGQSVYMGANLFNIEGALDNSLLERDDISVRWWASIGDISAQRDRTFTYTAPHQAGNFAIRGAVKQEVSGGSVQFNIFVPVRVLSDAFVSSPYNPPIDIPETTYAGGFHYGIVTPAEGIEYTDPDVPHVSLSVPSRSIPDDLLIGIRIQEEGDAADIQDEIIGHRAVGSWYSLHAVSTNHWPIHNFSFNAYATLCIPVDDDQFERLANLELMRVLPDGSQELLGSPVKFHPDQEQQTPAAVCALGMSFDGKLLLAQPDDTIPTPTPELPPTNTPEPTSTSTPVPTDTPVPTNTPIPPNTPTPVPLPPTSTPTQTATATPTPIPTDTPVPTSTATATPTETPPPTEIPVPTATNHTANQAPDQERAQNPILVVMIALVIVGMIAAATYYAGKVINQRREASLAEEEDDPEDDDSDASDSAGDEEEEEEDDDSRPNYEVLRYD